MSEKKSGANVGRTLRLTVLLLILFVMAGVFLYDRFVVRPANEKKLNAVLEYIDKNFDGLTKDKLEEQIGFKAATQNKEGEAEIHTYRYGGALPFLPATNLFVRYENNLYIKHSGELGRVSTAAVADEFKHPPAQPVKNIPAPAVPMGAGT